MDKKKIKKRSLRTFVAIVCIVSFLAGDVANAQPLASQDREELDYIKGRPLTEQEIESQKQLEPKYMPELPAEDISVHILDEETNADASEEETSADESKDSYNSDQKGSSSLPASYSSRALGYVTAPKNQNPWGTCWAFSTIACAETSLVSKGLMTLEEADLSEQHLTYFYYHPQTDPLGNTEGDRFVLEAGQDYMKMGGVLHSAAFTAANWMGFAAESLAPYPNTEEYPANLDTKLAYQDVAHLENAWWVSSQEVEKIKSMLMEHGAAAISMYFDNNYYNYDTAAYYCNTLYKTNHGVTVVGWDDAYSKENFKEGKRPSSDGAWLIKNSWSEEWGDEGYFWLSYEDAALLSNGLSFLFFEAEKADVYDHNYHYDGSNKPVYVSSSDINLAAVYQAKAGVTGAESLKAVGIAVHGSDMPYSIQVYKDLLDPNNPESGTKIFKEPQMGIFPGSGYYTIPLEEEVPLEEGTVFSVVVKLEKGTDERTGYYIDLTGDGRVTAQSAGQTFRKNQSQDNWEDMGASDSSTLRLKAFTSDIQPVPVQSVSLSPAQTTLNWNDRTTLRASLLPANTTQTKLTWDSSNPSVAAVDQAGQVTAVGAGECKITATTKNGSQASCTVTVLKRKTAKRLSTIVTNGENLCTKATIVHSSGYNSDDWKPSNLIDGNLQTTWLALTQNATDKTYLDNGGQHSVIIDLGKSQSFNTYTLFHAEKEQKTEKNNTNSWELLTSEDKKNWTSVDYQEGNKESQTSFQIENQKARYVMLKIWVSDNENGGTVRLREMMLFHIQPIPVQSVSLTPAQTTLSWNGRTTLRASLVPANTTQTKLTWDSSNPSVAAVDQAGQVTAVGAGECKITATTENGKKASCTITVLKKKTAKRLSSVVTSGKNLCTKATIVHSSGYASEDQQTSYLIDGNPETRWCASLHNVTDNTYLENGEQHSVIIDLGKSQSFNTYTLFHEGTRGLQKYNTNSWELLTSEDKKNWISVDYQEGNTESQTSFQIENQKARYVMLKIWVSDNEKIGTVSLYEMMLFHIQPIPVQSVSLTPAQTTLNWNDRTTLRASLVPANTTQTKLTWDSSNPSVAAVDQAGQVTAVGAGECKITATTENGKKASCTITVLKKKTAKRLSSVVTSGKNLCTKATIVHSSGYNSDYWKPSNLIDGNLQTTWLALTQNATDKTYLDNGGQHSVIIDLGKSQSFNTYTLFHAEKEQKTEKNNTNSWELLTSEDKKNWTSVDYQEGNKESQTSFQIGNQKARYVMLKIWVSDNENGGTVRLREMMLFQQKSPKTPSLSTVANVSSGINIKWKKVSNASGYYIYRKSSGGKWKKIATLKKGTATSYTDKSVKSKDGSVYSYTVAAYNQSFTGKYNTSGKKITRLSTPSLSQLKSKTSKTMTVKWKRNKKADGYQIQYALNRKFTKASSVTVKSGKTISKTIKKLRKNKTYYVRIKAYKKSGKTNYYSAWSNVQKVKVK